jgi:hypothetical protein
LSARHRRCRTDILGDLQKRPFSLAALLAFLSSLTFSGADALRVKPARREDRQGPDDGPGGVYGTLVLAALVSVGQSGLLFDEHCGHLVETLLHACTG